MMKFFIFLMGAGIKFFTGLSLCSLSFGHQDEVLRFTEGKIEGLPREFSPASFDLETGQLEVGTRKVVLPKYFRVDLLAGVSVEIRASWYHEDEKFPPYISIRSLDKSERFFTSILFDLSSLKFIEMAIWVLEGEDVIRIYEIAIPQSVQDEMEDNPPQGEVNKLPEIQLPLVDPFKSERQKGSVREK